jgi:hypothetical protein
MAALAIFQRKNPDTLIYYLSPEYDVTVAGLNPGSSSFAF